MCIEIKRYGKEHINDVVDFEKELRIQEPNTYYWDIDDSYWICVLKQERHKGIAQQLLQALKEILKQRNIETLIILTAGNEEATKFYDTCENMEFCRGAMLRIS